MVSTLIIAEKQSQVRYPTCMSIVSHNVAKGTEKRATRNVQLVLQHCCKTSWIAMLRILPPMFKPVNNLICCQTGLMWVVKHTTLLFSSFWSNVARQVAHFLLPVFRTLTLFRNILNNVSGNNFYLLQRMNANYRSTALAIVDDDIIIIKLLLTLKPATHQNL